MRAVHAGRRAADEAHACMHHVGGGPLMTAPGAWDDGRKRRRRRMVVMVCMMMFWCGDVRRSVEAVCQPLVTSSEQGYSE